MPKTSDLVEKTTLVAADEILIVDSAVVDPTSDEATKYVTEANFSAQVQDDLMANAAVTEATVATDTVPILASSVNSKITLQNLMIQMKGYKEYTFAIRQSGTDAPTLYKEKNDFNDETLVATYKEAGHYRIDYSSLNLTTDERLNFRVSNNLMYDDEAKRSVYINILSSTEFDVFSYYENTLIDDVLRDNFGIKISLEQTLE